MKKQEILTYSKMKQSFKAPVLLIAFNRPDHTKKVLECIEKYEPNNLYIACDAPRSGNELDLINVKEVKNLINNINLNCKITTLFQSTNLGCRDAVNSAISWFFSNEEMGIILEDDILPSMSFFNFCNENLIRYKNCEDIMTICGYNPFGITQKNIISYFFSSYTFVWGWASWRRAWHSHDITLDFWPNFRDSKEFVNSLPSYSINYWRQRFNEVYEEGYDTWDYGWQCSIFKNKGVNIIPEINLIKNIGFGLEATHTTNLNIITPNAHDYSFLEHPSKLVISSNNDFDKHIFLNFMTTRYSRLAANFPKLNKIFQYLRKRVFYKS